MGIYRKFILIDTIALTVQWLNEVLLFVSSSVVADSLVLRNRQFIVAVKPWQHRKRETQEF